MVKKIKAYTKAKNKVDFSRGAAKIIDLTKPLKNFPPKPINENKITFVIKYYTSTIQWYIIYECLFEEALKLLGFNIVNGVIYRTNINGTDYIYIFNNEVN